MIEVGNDILKEIDLAKMGDKDAVERLLIIVRDEHMRRAISRFMNKNRLAEDDDIKQMFMIGVANAIPTVRLDIGNPLIYLINCGIWKVRSYFRSQIFTNTKQTCLKCGHTCRPTKTIKKCDVVVTKSQDWICPACSSNKVNIIQITGAEVKDGNVMVVQESSSIESEVEDSMLVDDFRKSLNGRVLELFDMLNGGVDRDGTNSYMRDIADKWGVSTACVAIYLKRLKLAWKKYFDAMHEIDRRIG